MPGMMAPRLFSQSERLDGRAARGQEPVLRPAEPDRGQGQDMEQVVGLDVSKQWLDGYLVGSGRRVRVTDDPEGIERVMDELAGTDGCLVVMAVSGGTERIAHRELTARGVPTAIADPSIGRSRSIRFAKRRRAGGRRGRVRDCAGAEGIEAEHVRPACGTGGNGPVSTRA